MIIDRYFTPGARYEIPISKFYKKIQIQIINNHLIYIYFKL